MPSLLEAILSSSIIKKVCSSFHQWPRTWCYCIFAHNCPKRSVTSQLRIFFIKWTQWFTPACLLSNAWPWTAAALLFPKVKLAKWQVSRCTFGLLGNLLVVSALNKKGGRNVNSCFLYVLFCLNGSKSSSFIPHKRYSKRLWVVVCSNNHEVWLDRWQRATFPTYILKELQNKVIKPNGILAAFSQE